MTWIILMLSIGKKISQYCIEINCMKLCAIALKSKRTELRSICNTVVVYHKATLLLAKFQLALSLQV